jgi:regulatory protein
MRVHLDRGEPFDVALEALERMGLGVGDLLPSNRRHHLLDADAEAQVRTAALDLLSHRARTRAELRRKLVSKGFRPARVDLCLDRLARRGLLDDRAVASAFVRDRIRHRPRGRARLAQELRAKGVPDSVAREAVEAVLEEEALTDEALATKVLEGWLKRQGPATLRSLAESAPGPERERARRRLHGYLARRGFRGPAITSALDAAVALARGTVTETPAWTSVKRSHPQNGA